MVSTTPQRNWSASFGVKLSPLPVPSNFINETPGNLLSKIRLVAIKIIASGK